MTGFSHEVREAAISVAKSIAHSTEVTEVRAGVPTVDTKDLAPLIEEVQRRWYGGQEKEWYVAPWRRRGYDESRGRHPAYAGERSGDGNHYGYEVEPNYQTRSPRTGRYRGDYGPSSIHPSCGRGGCRY